MRKENTTGNIVVKNKNLEVLKENFPQCFDKNGDFDFVKFQKELQIQEIDFSKESYSMDWLGKSYARLLASDRAKTLLKEDKAWNQQNSNSDSQNLLLKGDNLEILKHLSNAYNSQIKMIYIDPPYNTGSDGFVYEDDRKFTVEQFSQLAGLDLEKSKKILNFVNSKSNSHSAWLTFMYPRLYIARQLLRDDGVIFISIDDNEVAQLRILMDEIFGEENFVGNISRMTKRGGNKGEFNKPKKDYVIIYFKNIENIISNNFGKTISIEGFNWEKELFNGQERYYIKGDIPYREKLETRKNQRYYIEAPDGSLIIPPGNVFPDIKKDGEMAVPLSNKDKCWSWSRDRYLEEKLQNRFIFIKSSQSPFLDENGNKSNYTVYKKVFKNEKELQKEVFIDFLDKFQNSLGTKRLENLCMSGIFENPKPNELIKYLSEISTSSNDIILDFFAGSGTTADAIMQLNAEDRANGKEGNRKFILIQLPEKIDVKKNKTAYDFVKDELGVSEPTIFEITKERLIRAAKKIQQESKDKTSIKDIDFGFKIFETIPIWENYEFDSVKLDSQQKLFDESTLTAQDLQTLLITWKTNDNVPLTQDLILVNLGDYFAYYAKSRDEERGKLYLIDKGFETKHLKCLIEKIDIDPEFRPSLIIAFGFNFESKCLREIAENCKNYANKKSLEIDFVIRY